MVKRAGCPREWKLFKRTVENKIRSKVETSFICHKALTSDGGVLFIKGNKD